MRYPLYSQFQNGLVSLGDGQFLKTLADFDPSMSTAIVCSDLRSDIAIDNLDNTKSCDRESRLVFLQTIDRAVGQDISSRFPATRVIQPSSDTLLVGPSGCFISTPRLLKRIRNCLPLLRNIISRDEMIRALPPLMAADLHDYLDTALRSPSSKHLRGTKSVAPSSYFNYIDSEPERWVNAPEKHGLKLLRFFSEAHPPMITYGSLSKVVDEQLLAASLKALKVESTMFLVNSRSTVSAQDGTPLQAYAFGDPSNSPVLSSNAVGMPVELLRDVIVRLQERHYVITWESRYLFSDGDTDPLDFSAETQIRDMLDVLDFYNVEKPAHLLTGCIGSLAAINAAVCFPSRFASMALANPGFGFLGRELQGDFEAGFGKFRRRIAEDLAVARSMHKIYLRSSKSTLDDDEEMALVQYPYCSGQVLYRYANLVNKLAEVKVRDLAGSIYIPSLSIAARDDDVVSPQAAELVSGLLPDSRLVVLDRGGHIPIANSKLALEYCMEHFSRAESKSELVL